MKSKISILLHVHTLLFIGSVLVETICILTNNSNVCSSSHFDFYTSIFSILPFKSIKLKDM